MSYTKEAMRLNWKELKTQLLYYGIAVGMDEEYFDSYYYDVIEPAYTDPARHYHNLTHIYKTLFSIIGVDFMKEKDRYLVKLALWFHDIIYYPASSKNELLSALTFNCFAEKVGITDTNKHTVYGLIMVTDHKHSDLNFLQMVVCDADLCDLDGDYFKNSLNIRKEYSHLSDKKWRQGRIEFLESFLKKPVLFRTIEFRHKEPEARSNLKAELQYLKNLKK